LALFTAGWPTDRPDALEIIESLTRQLRRKRTKYKA